MATISISVPDEVLREAKARVGKRGHATVEEYLLSFIHALALEGEPIDAETEAALLEGLDSPLVEMTGADWEAKLRRYDERRRGARSRGDAR